MALPPALATRAIATTLVVVVGAAIPTMWLTAFALAAHSPVTGGEFAWCAHALAARPGARKDTLRR